MDNNLQGSSVHIISQAGVLEWVAIFYSNTSNTYKLNENSIIVSTLFSFSFSNAHINFTNILKSQVQFITESQIYRLF